MTEIRPFAFVLMPFDREFGDIYKYGIKKTADELGVVAERVDEQHFSETILERVYRQIENCDFIIADMTGMNANVFYEVGYAHAKGKLCALLTQNATDIPFDLKHHTHVIYDGSATDLAEKLRPKLEWLVGEVTQPEQEPFRASHKSPAGFLDSSKYWDTGKFDLEVTLRNESEKRTPEIEAYYFVTSRRWHMSVDGSECPFDDFVDDEGAKKRKHLVNPTLRRLAPGAFAKISPVFEGKLWNLSSGEEKKERYNAKGVVKLEIVTSEGTFEHEFSLDVQFDEIPF